MRAVRRISRDQVREMCIRHDYYTNGNNADYTNMLNCVEDAKADDLDFMVAIAEDIYDHSDVNHFLALYGCSSDDFKDSILFNLYNECCTTIIERR